MDNIEGTLQENTLPDLASLTINQEEGMEPPWLVGVEQRPAPRTMQEYEKLLVELRRDNMALKMRIYLMEEEDEGGEAGPRVGPTALSAVRALQEHNSKLEEEVCRLKEEVSGKKELVEEAARALEALERESREATDRLQREALTREAALHSDILLLSKELMELKRQAESANLGGVNDSVAMCAIAFGLNGTCQNVKPVPAIPSDDHLANQVSLLELKCAKLEEELRSRENELVEAHCIIENQARFYPLSAHKDKPEGGEGGGLSDLEKGMSFLKEQLRAKEEEASLLREENTKAMKTIQGFVKQNRALTRDLEAKEKDTPASGKISSDVDKDSKILELENEVSLLTEELSSLKKAVDGPESSVKSSSAIILSLRADLEAKRKEVECLNEELRKRTFNLQELVNKELWDKNREIEKLNNVCEKRLVEVSSLKRELALRGDYKENKSPNIVKEGELERLMVKLEEEGKTCSRIRVEMLRWRERAEETDRARKEQASACSLLTTRLEELANFLESLLPSLGSKKRRMLQQAIDRSREMSRSFSFVQDPGQAILPDVSQVEFGSEESEVLRLRSELVSELRPHSESDWSEPDLQVSKERIGISDQPPLPTHSSEDSSAYKKSPSSKKCRVEGGSELRRLSAKLDCLEKLNEALHSELCILRQTNVVTACRPTPPPIDADVAKLEKPCESCSELEEKLTDLECAIAASEGRLEETEARCSALVSQVEEARSKIENVQLEAKTSRDQLQSTESQCSELAADLGAVKAERDTALRDLKQSQEQLNQLETRCSALLTDLEAVTADREAALQDKRCCEERLREAESRHSNLLTDLDNARSALQERDNFLLEKQCSLLEANNEALILKARVDTLTENLEIKQGMIKKYEGDFAEVNRRLLELEADKSRAKSVWLQEEKALSQQLQAAKAQVDEEIERRLEAERRLVDCCERHAEITVRLGEEAAANGLDTQTKVAESGWRRRLAERESTLRRRLDAALLSTSEAVLERTRLANDKLRLQHLLRDSDATHSAVIKVLERRVMELECLGEPIQSDPNSNQIQGWWEGSSSPDLGIESDRGPSSSLDHLPLTSNKGNWSKLELENEQLKRHLQKTRKALEDTLSQLTSANHKKRQVERAICKQLHKTHHILQQARVNLDPAESVP